MKTLKIIAVLLLLVLLCSISPAQVTLDLQLVNPTMQVLSLGDLDFTNTGLVSNIFRIVISNGQPPATLSLRLTIKYNGVEIASGTSNSFDLPANFSTTISSQELSAGTAQINGQSISLGDYDVNLNAVPGFENQAIQTGFAPAGTYVFELTGLPGPINDPNQGNNIITITNPTYITLIIPGNSISDPVIQEISTPYPYFQWQTDVPPTSASNYSVFVYQKYAEDETATDVISHPPMLHIEGYQNSFFQYPTSTSGNSILDPYPTDQIELQILALRPLEPDNTYYWFVRSNIQGATGTTTIESDVFRFRVAGLAQAGANAQQILAILRQILGPNFEQVLNNLIEQGFDPNGDISLDGQSGDMVTLLEIANQVASGQLNIEDVKIY